MIRTFFRFTKSRSAKIAPAKLIWKKAIDKKHLIRPQSFVVNWDELIPYYDNDLGIASESVEELDITVNGSLLQCDKKNLRNVLHHALGLAQCLFLERLCDTLQAFIAIVVELENDPGSYPDEYVTQMKNSFTDRVLAELSMARDEFLSCP